MIVLENGVVVVLELKGEAVPSQADIDQVFAYARDLRSYHRECADRPVHAVLVPSRGDATAFCSSAPAHRRRARSAPPHQAGPRRDRAGSQQHHRHRPRSGGRTHASPGAAHGGARVWGKAEAARWIGWTRAEAEKLQVWGPGRRVSDFAARTPKAGADFFGPRLVDADYCLREMFTVPIVTSSMSPAYCAIRICHVPAERGVILPFVNDLVARL